LIFPKKTNTVLKTQFFKVNKSQVRLHLYPRFLPFLLWPADLCPTLSLWTLTTRLSLYLASCGTGWCPEYGGWAWGGGAWCW